MIFLSNLFRGKQTIAPQTAVPTLVLFKRKKWVVYKGALGIVKDITGPDTCIISLVAPSTGHTVEDATVPISECRIARYEELKTVLEARNKEPFTYEQSCALGYF